MKTQQLSKVQNISMNLAGYEAGRDLEKTFHSEFNLKETNSGWYAFDCPFCGKAKKHAVNFEFGWCKCWVCGHSSGIINFWMLYKNISYNEAREIFGDVRRVKEYLPELKKIEKPKNEIQLPNGFQLILDGDSDKADKAREYLRNRNFDIQYLDSLGVGYVDSGYEFNGYIILPYFCGGKLVYYTARTFMNNPLRYKNPKLDISGKSDFIYNEDAIYCNEKIWLMEGVFSSFAANGLGIAIGGKSLSVSQFSKLLKAPFKELVICLDADTEFESFSIAVKFAGYKDVKIIKIKEGDPADLGNSKLLELYEATELNNL